MPLPKHSRALPSSHTKGLCPPRPLFSVKRGPDLLWPMQCGQKCWAISGGGFKSCLVMFQRCLAYEPGPWQSPCASLPMRKEVCCCFVP